MKLLFVSDMHGSAFYAEKLKEIYSKEKPNKLILLGDLMYHGPRNSLPEEYNPQKVAEILNSLKEHIICVRGNCDSEVDQMLLDFDIMKDYTTIFIDGLELFITHGHVYNSEKLPKSAKKLILIHGHTHVQVAEDRESHYYINPGSIAIPKDGDPSTYMIYENHTFIIKDLEGNAADQITIGE